MDILECPELTYANRRRKDNMYIGKYNGEKRYIQKTHPLWRLSHALEIANSQQETFNKQFDEDFQFNLIILLRERSKLPDTLFVCK